MVLADALRFLLSTGEQLIDDPAIRQGVANDLQMLESKVAEGIEAAEQHVAGWLAGHYSVPAPTAPVATVPEPVTVPGTVTSLDGTTAPADGTPAS